jgi:type I restriction enzyme S subunit
LIPIPPYEEQKRIEKIASSFFDIIGYISSNTDDLRDCVKQTKTKVLDLAIHGKLVPQDPNDEPAIELLKRINPKFTPCDNAHYENLPKGWTEINVGELAQYTNGKAFQPSDWEQRGLPIIRIQNLNDENCKYNYTSIGHEEKYRITNGDLLFAWAASLGVYIWKGDDAWLNQHIFKVEPFPFIDKQFLYYLFQYLISEFYNRSHGSGMVHITKKEFETTIALLPPLSEQSRIVKSIESYYATLDNISANL